MTSLRTALGVAAGDVVAVVGAGGKSTVVERLAEETVAGGATVLVTCTTHTGPPASSTPVFFDGDSAIEADALAAALNTHRRATVLSRRLRDDKWQGLSAERVDALAPRGGVTLMEADGARRRSLKVPAEHEPVLPGRTTLVVVVVGLDVLGRPFDEGSVHRFELVQAVTGLAAGEAIGEEAVAAALAAPSGYRSRIPGGARSAVFLNKAESPALEAAAARIASSLGSVYGVVAAGSARDGVARILSGQSLTSMP